jgi:hypothetical protein
VGADSIFGFPDPWRAHEVIDAHQDDVSAYGFVCQVDFSWRTSAWAFSDMRANTPCHTMGSATPSF